MRPFGFRTITISYLKINGEQLISVANDRSFVQVEGLVQDEIKFLRIEIVLNFSFIYVFVRLTLIGFAFCKRY